jgi:toxin ParE1/3/4
VKAYVLDPQAQAELDDAAVRYEDERPGRGLRFADAVEAAIAVAVESPSAAPLVPYTRRELELRHRPVRRFPYLVIYRDEGPFVRVIAIAHGKRRPGYWLARLGDRR